MAPANLMAALAALMAVLPSALMAATFLVSPTVVPNPNPRAPLVAILQFTADKPVETSVHVQEVSGPRAWTVTFAPDERPEKGLALLGMRPGRPHAITVTIRDRQGRQVRTAQPLHFSTPALPADRLGFPPIQLTRSEAARLEPGITFLSVRRHPLVRELWATPAQEKFARQWGAIVAVDAAGEVVWYYQSDSRVAGIYRLDNGNIFFHSTAYHSVEIDMLGNRVRHWYAARRPQGVEPGAIPVDVDTLHHQPHQMPNGHFLAMSTTARRIENFVSSEVDPAAPRAPRLVIGDQIIEFDEAGRIVWRWNAFDHLDIHRIGYQVLDAFWHTRGFAHHADWTHGNGVTHDPRDGGVIMSFRNQDAIVKADRASGEIRWILGDHGDWNERLRSKLLQPVGNLRWPYHGHNPRVTAAGTIVLFDNGILGARPYDPPLPPDRTFSRGVEFEVDEKAMTVRQVWASAAALTEDSCNSWAMGDTHRLPATANMLVVYAACLVRLPGMSYNEFNPATRHPDDVPSWARVREYSRAQPPEVLWELVIRDPDDAVKWEVYGGFRSPGAYADGRDAERWRR